MGKARLRELNSHRKKLEKKKMKISGKQKQNRRTDKQEAENCTYG